MGKRFAGWLVVCWVLGIGPAVWAADKPKKEMAELSEVDADYRLQGEYAGWVWQPEAAWRGVEPTPATYAWGGSYRWTGLQVVAVGRGKFDALLHVGGLPGNSVTVGEPWKLSGTVEDGRLTLRGKTLTITTSDGRAAEATDANGTPCGRLQKLERHSAWEGLKPPPGAEVLFEGKPTELLKNAKLTEDGLLKIGAETAKTYRDFYLHAEFRTPYMPEAKGQARGNSGFYLQKRYEVQVLDSFGLIPEFNDCASLYRFHKPDLNMSFPPLTWQTYDIRFRSPRFDADGKRIEKGRITVWHNGIVVQNNLELENKTGGGQPEGTKPFPILLQDHGNAVRFRNLWIVSYDQPEAPAAPVPTPAAETPASTVCTVPVVPTCCEPCLTRKEWKRLHRGCR